MSDKKIVLKSTNVNAKNSNGRVYSEIPEERFIEAIKRASEEIKKTGKVIGSLDHKDKEFVQHLNMEEVKYPPGMNIAVIQPERINPETLEKNLINAKKLIENGKVCA